MKRWYTCIRFKELNIQNPISSLLHPDFISRVSRCFPFHKALLWSQTPLRTWLQTRLSSSTLPNILRKWRGQSAMLWSENSVCARISPKRITLNTGNLMHWEFITIYFSTRGEKIETTEMPNKRAMVMWIIVFLCHGKQCSHHTLSSRLCSNLRTHLG